MNPELRLVKLFEWGDKNEIVIFLKRFKQYSKGGKEFKRWFELDFLEVDKSNSPHRTSSGKGEDLTTALDNVWKHYKRK